MQDPTVGKREDVKNKRGITALFNRNEDEAMRQWCLARNINQRHFDSICNYVLYRWSTAKIDEQQMTEELTPFVFTNPNKGRCLKAYLKLAVGDHDQGMRGLREYIDQTKAKLASMRVINEKYQSQLEKAEAMLQSLTLEKEMFIQNWKGKHEHEEKISHCQYSSNSKYLVTMCSMQTQCWKLIGSMAMSYAIIAAEKSNKPSYGNKKPLACISNDGKTVVTYRN